MRAISASRSQAKKSSVTVTNHKVYDFLNSHHSGVLATVDTKCQPYGAVIYYAINSSLTVRFLTKRNTHKSQNLQHNNHAVLVVFDEESQSTVQITGTVLEITDIEDAHKVFRSTLRKSLHASRSGIPPISRLSAGDYIAYQLKPTEIRMAMYKKTGLDNYSQMFDVINLSGKDIRG